MPFETDIPDVQIGDLYSASDQNRLRERLRKFTPISGGEGINVVSSERGGIAIGLDFPLSFLERGAAMIVDAKSAGNRFSDERYYLQPMYQSNPVDDPAAAAQWQQFTPNTDQFPTPFIAHNIVECVRKFNNQTIPASHLLGWGEVVHYFPFYTPGGIKRYAFQLQPNRAVLVSIAGGAGPSYSGNIVGGLGEAAVVSGSIAYSLGSGTYPGVLTSRDSDNTAHVTIFAVDYEDCTTP